MPTPTDLSDLGQGRLPDPRYDLYLLNRPVKIALDIYPKRLNIPYAEVPYDSPEESYINGEWNVKRTFRIPWKWRHQWQFEMLGGSWLNGPVTNGDTSQGYHIRRMTPTAYMGVPSPDTTAARDNRSYGYNTFILPYACERIVGIKPMGRQSSYSPSQNVSESYVGDYKWGLATLLYKSVPYDICEDGDPLILGTSNGMYAGYPDESQLTRFVSKEAQPAAQFFHLPMGAYKWVELSAASQNSPLIGANSRPVGHVEYHLTWHAAPAVPTWARRLLGHVNSVTFDNKKPGLLMYTGCQIMRYIGPHGFKQYNITYRFRHFETSLYIPVVDSSTADNTLGKGHNYFLRYTSAGGLVYQLATHNGKPMSEGGLPVFPPGDFRRLFRFNETNTFNPTDTSGSFGQFEHF